MNVIDVPTVRLTSLAHGGGCGCKLAPSVLRQLLLDQPSTQPYRDLLVGTETGDDAAVWQLDDKTCIIATTDFFMPMVDDPFDFGRIAATNAISDIYAMGGKPVMALAILGMPIDKVPPSIVREILKGGSHVCAAAGIPVAGGHSIELTGADLWSCRDRPWPSRRHPTQQWNKSGRRADSDQSARRRSLFGGVQENRTVARSVRGNDRVDDPAQQRRCGFGQGPSRACHHRRDRLWIAGPCT